MIDESAKILKEGRTLRSPDIDVVRISGYGWPAYRGGPVFYGDPVHLGTPLAKMRACEAVFGMDFKAAASLERLAVEGKGFRDL